MPAPLAWPFHDEKSSGVYTVEDVLSGGTPILCVYHDVAEGAWQFLTGKEVELSPPTRVGLADLVSLDPSLLDLADLPLGFAATRARVIEPWVRTAMYQAVWSELLTQAYAYTEMQQARLRDEFELLKWERFDYQQATERLTLSCNSSSTNESADDSSRCLVMQATIVGSISAVSGSWLWAWGNPHLDASVARASHWLKRFGIAAGHEPLIRATFAADEVDGWEMTTVACLLLGGSGVYRAPHESGAVYLVLSDPRLENP